MKKSNLTLMAVSSLCALTLLSGCSWMDKEEKKVEDETKEVADKAKDAGDKTKNSIEDMMTYFKDEGLEATDVKTLDNMDFAAHEGRSFMYNGSNVYLYNLNMEDEGMKSLVKDVEKNKTVKVNQDGSEKEYAAMANGSYLLVYDKEADMGDMINTFPTYSMTK